MGKRIIILLFFFLPVFAIAQTMEEVDKKTYSQYVNGNWKELIKVGKQAQQGGIDFYYLRSRMAISYYKLKKYRKAIPIFEQILRETPGDPVINEYLYWAYVFSGRNKDALLFSGKLSNEERQRLNAKPRFIATISAAGGIGFNPDYDNHLNTPIFSDGEIPADEIGFEKQQYLNFGVVQELFPWLSVSHSYTQLNIDRYQRFEYPNAFSVDDNDVRQKQYFIGANIALGRGWHLQPSYHSFWGKVSTVGFDTVAYKPYDIRSSYSEGVAALVLKKEAGNWLLSMGGLSGTINTEDVSQLNTGLVFYPKGNADLYLGANYYYQNRKGSQEDKTSNIFSGRLGGRLGRIWLEGNATFGELVNFVDNDNQTIWNSIFPVKNKYGAAVFLPVANYKVVFSLRYTYLNMEGTMSAYNDSGNPMSSTYEIKNQLITGGVAWNF